MSNQQRNQSAGIYERSGEQDPVSIYIGDMLRRMPLTSPKHSIFRVRHPLREVNEKAYDPEVLAIGPYHHGNDKFKFMEEQKLRYLRRLLERRYEGSIDRYVSTLRILEQPARNCYAETIDSSQENFLAMMLIDGCFIVEFFRKGIGGGGGVLIDEDDPIMHECGILTSIRRDLLLLENQLPLFVLSKLYDLTKGPDEDDNFSDVAIRYFNFELRGPSQDRTIDKSQGEHLLHLYHMWRTSVLPKTPQQFGITVMPSATELRESGVRFRALQWGKPIDIKFKKGTLEIPVLYVGDSTESQFHNLIAYEQYRQSRGINYFTDYVTFLNCLINSSNDVEVLRRAGIINNFLGDNEVVVQMFNKIGDYIIVSDSYYSEILKNVNAYCDVWTVKLRRAYFHNPWAFLPIPGAFSLLLTVAQTILSILSYKKQS